MEILGIIRKKQKRCKTCKGTGKIMLPYSGILEHYPAKTMGGFGMKKTCPDCGGTGKVQ